MTVVSRNWPLSGGTFTPDPVGFGLTSPTMVAIDDGTYATASVPADTTKGEKYGGFGFDALIPSDAVINSVELQYQAQVSSIAGTYNVGASIYVAGAIQGGPFSHTFAAANVDQTFTDDATSRRAWTPEDLYDDTFFVRIAATVNPLQATRTFKWDYLRVIVDYTPTPKTIAVGRATELDAARTITPRRTRAVTAAAETDAAQAMALIRSPVVGQAEEIDQAQEIPHGMMNDAAPAWYGVGRGLDIVVDSDPFTLVDPRDSSLNLIESNVLQRAVNCRTLTIAAGCTLQVSKTVASRPSLVFPIYVADLLLNEGLIVAYGDPLGTTGHWYETSAVPQGTVGVGGDGEEAGVGGVGGDGGDGSVAGGAAVLNSWNAAAASLLHLTTARPVLAGGPGAAGGGDGTNAGGDGGYAGPGVLIAALRFDNSQGTISVIAGDGAAGAGGNAGGGGGGGGGVVTPVFGTLIDLGTIWVASAIGGAGQGTGEDGLPGSEGTVYPLQL